MTGRRLGTILAALSLAVTGTITLAQDAPSGDGALSSCIIRALEEDGKDRLQIEGVPSALCVCGTIRYKLPDGTVVTLKAATKQILVQTTLLKAWADQMSFKGPAPLSTLLLEGHVSVYWNKEGHHADIVAERVAVGLLEGRIEMLPKAEAKKEYLVPDKTASHVEPPTPYEPPDPSVIPSSGGGPDPSIRAFVDTLPGKSLMAPSLRDLWFPETTVKCDPPKEEKLDFSYWLSFFR